MSWDDLIEKTVLTFLCLILIGLVVLLVWLLVVQVPFDNKIKQQEADAMTTAAERGTLVVTKGGK